MLLCQVSCLWSVFQQLLLACLRVVLCSQARCSSASSSHGLCLLWIHVCPPPSHSDLTWGPSQLRTTDLSKDQVHVTAATKSPQLKDPASAHLPIKRGGSRNCHHRKGQESERSAEPPPHPRQLPHKEEEEQEDQVMASRGPSLRCPSGRGQSSVSRGGVGSLPAPILGHSL